MNKRRATFNDLDLDYVVKIMTDLEKVLTIARYLLKNY